MLGDINLREAAILWNKSDHKDGPSFCITTWPMRHRYDQYRYSGGACYTDWRECKNSLLLRLRLMNDIWQIASFHHVPIEMMLPELLRIPEYRLNVDPGWLPQPYRDEQLALINSET
jgi:hypothetical protein